MLRERYGVILLAEEAAGQEAAAVPPDPGVPAAWVVCEVVHPTFVARDHEQEPTNRREACMV